MTEYRSHQPFFSIIIATFNRVNLLRQAIQSVLDQRFKEWELIIVDDGSTDGTNKLIRELGDSRIRYYFQDNQGRSSARNKGITIAKGNFFCFLDDDDWYYPDFLDEMQKFILSLKEKNAVYFCAQHQYNACLELIDTSGKWLEGNPVKFVLESLNNLQAAVFSKEIIKDLRFDERFELGEDFHFILPIVLKNQGFYLNKYLVAYRNHPGSTMEREFSANFINELSYNRLDVMQDLWEKYENEICRSGAKKSFLTKHNKIRYFYASAWMKNSQTKKSLDVIRQLNMTDWNAPYYFLSILSRIWFYRILEYRNG